MKQDGYIALVSTMVIMVVLIVITSTLSLSGYFSRFNVLKHEYKRTSSYLAEACADEALLLVANNKSYAPISGGQPIVINSTTGTSCKLCSVGSGSPRTILTRAKYNNSITNIQVTATLTNTAITVTAWQENPTYSDVSCPL